MRYREHEILLWFRITTWAITCDAFVVQPSLQWPKINKAMGTIKGGRGNVTDLERKNHLAPNLSRRATMRNKKGAQQLCLLWNRKRK